MDNFLLWLSGAIAGIIVGLLLGGNAGRDSIMNEISICQWKEIPYEECAEIYQWEFKSEKK